MNTLDHWCYLWLFPHCFYLHSILFCPLLLCWFTGTWFETWCHQLSKYLDNSRRLKCALMCIFLCWFDRSSRMNSVIQYLSRYFYQEELWALVCTQVCHTLLMILLWLVFLRYRNLVKNQTFVWMKTNTCVFTANRHQASGDMSLLLAACLVSTNSSGKYHTLNKLSAPWCSLVLANTVCYLGTVALTRT